MDRNSNYHLDELLYCDYTGEVVDAPISGVI